MATLSSTYFSSIEFIRDGFPDPFELEYVLGFNKHIAVRHYRNKKEQDCFVYSMSNILSIYNLNTKTYQNALGHHECILNYNIDENNKIMHSADILAILIWDLRPGTQDLPVILRVIEQPFGINKPILASSISRCGKYLILATDNILKKKNRASIPFPRTRNNVEVTPTETKEHMIQSWEWSYGRKSPDEKYRLLENMGGVKSITFSRTNKLFFAVTYSSKVLFGIIEKGKYTHTLKIHLSDRGKYRNLRKSCFLTNSPYLATISQGGNILIWTELSTKNYNNDKRYLKTLKMDCEVNDIKCFDNLLVLANSRGEICFLDYDLKLVYRCSSKETGATNILSISPVQNKREYKLWEPNDILTPKEKHLELIPLINCPLNFAEQPKPIVIRKFFFINSTGELYLHDPVYKKTTPFLIHSDDIHVTFSVFPIKPWILICSRDGHVRYFHKINEMEVSHYFFTVAKRQGSISDIFVDAEHYLKISVCTISNNEKFVAIGFENGDICMLDPITAKPLHKKLMNFSPDHIMNICFCPENDRLCAYYDNKFTVVCIKYKPQHKTWYSVGKFRYHCDNIINIFFTTLNDKNYLLSVGSDRMYVKYQLLTATKASIVHKSDVRLEQTAKITAAALLDSSFLEYDTSKYKKILLTANDQYKLVVFDAFTAENLFTFLGPVFDSPLRNILYLKPTEDDTDSYFIFISDKTLGAALCPLDGNPFRYSGIYAHYKKINKLQVEPSDSMHLYVLGQNDAGEFYWKINKENIRKKHDFGGYGLEPFCKLLPGGKTGWLFKEIQDYFLYIQLVSDLSDAPEKKNVSDFIKTTELVIFMQAIGYFPSEFEIKNFTNEYVRTYGSFEAPPTLISFSKAVKLYLNHRPVDGYKLSDIKKSLLYLAHHNLHYFPNEWVKISLRSILELLTDRGESITRITAMKYIKELLEPKGRFISDKLTEAEVFSEFKQLPKKFDFHDFCEILLGLPILDKNKPDHHTISAFQGIEDPSLLVPELDNRIPLIISTSDDDFVEIMSAASDQQEESTGRRISRAPF